MNRSLLLDNNVSQFIIRYSGPTPPKQKTKPISVSSEHMLPKSRKKGRLTSHLISEGKPKPKEFQIHSIPTNTDAK